MTATTATEQTPGVRSIPQRLLGKTGELVPVLGLGTGPGGLGMKDDDAIALYQRAIDLGITYFDTAPGYGGAHRQLGEVLPPHREDCSSPARRTLRISTRRCASSSRA